MRARPRLMSSSALVAPAAWVAAALVAIAPDVARAETVGPECSAAQALDGPQLLRRLSLALRARLPSYDEYLALDALADDAADDSADAMPVPEALVDDMLGSDDFRLVMRRLHADLLWPNLAATRLPDVAHVITKGRNGDRHAVFGAQRRINYRGRDVPCGDWEQTDFTADGMPVTRTTGDPPYEEDGWVLVQPYWAPDTTIKVCAFDAQVAASAPLANGTPVACGSARGVAARGCGCGPDLRWCYGDGVDAAVIAALAEQLGRLVDAHTVGGRPYSELVTTRATFTNGTLAFWKQNLAGVTNLNRTFNAPMAVDEPPVADPDFTDTAWREATRAAPHSGLLTLPGYTLRFQTNRGRANRFRQVFTYQSFVAPASTADADCDPSAADLTQRCSCRHCHQVLEPLAAHFGVIAEAGSAVIGGAPEFPVYAAACDPTLPQNQDRAARLACERFYVTDPAAHAPGTLLAHQYADIDDALHRQIADNLASGPEGLARSAIDLGLLHGAITRHLFVRLMGRDFVLDPSAPDDETALFATLTAELRGHDDLVAQVKRIAMLPEFRRVR